MKNYYFKTYTKNKETYNFYKSLSKQELKTHLDLLFEELNDNLMYYACVMKRIFRGRDYNDFYYQLKSLTEDLDDIKTILCILERSDKND